MMEIDSHALRLQGFIHVCALHHKLSERKMQLSVKHFMCIVNTAGNKGFRGSSTPMSHDFLKLRDFGPFRKYLFFIHGSMDWGQ